MIQPFSLVMHATYLILGSNIPPRREFLDRAKAMLREKGGQILKQSSIYSTEPWGVRSKEHFLNQAILMETPLSPGEMLALIHQIEKTLGRKRTAKYSPRTIDIDILFWDHENIEEPRLKVPHPLIQDRKFVLAPLAEIAPEHVHPQLKIPVSMMLERCKDQKEVFILAAHEPADSI